MPKYNYFVCRHPTCNNRKASAPVPLSGAFANLACPACGRMMERYDSGDLPNDPRPVPPRGGPPAFDPPKLSARERMVYQGNGDNPGHPDVTWELTCNDAQAAWTLNLFLGAKVGGNWQSTLKAQFHHGLLTQGGGQPQDWLVSPPASTGAGQAWMSLDTRQLPAVQSNRFANQGHKVFNFTVKLGASKYGLIHLLAGHQKTVRKAAQNQVFSTGLAQDETFRTMSLLQAGLDRFSAQKVQRIVSAPGQKWLFTGEGHGFLVVRDEGGDQYSVTTTYNRNEDSNGQVWFEK